MTSPLDLSSLSLQLPNAPISQIANIIRKDWINMSEYAKPYVRAMLGLSSNTDTYGCDDAQTICLYFLSNAATWRGPVAKLVKAELKRRFC